MIIPSRIYIMDDCFPPHPFPHSFEMTELWCTDNQIVSIVPFATAAAATLLAIQ